MVEFEQVILTSHTGQMILMMIEGASTEYASGSSRFLSEVNWGEKWGSDRC
jgi:hypothetical protein